MLVELTPLALVLVNVAAWLVLHMTIPWAWTRAPAEDFDPGSRLFRKRAWEKDGKFYETVFSIRNWKDRLPDCGGIFAGGFSKADLSSTSREYLNRFLLETCRGEAVHWMVMASSLLFFIWNPWWAGIVMVLYAVSVNLPCILAQRYNRIRLMRLLRVSRKR